MQILILFKNMLPNQHKVALKQVTETLELWKNLLQKMNINPKVYELSQYSKLFVKLIFKLLYYFLLVFGIFLYYQNLFKL